MPSRARWPGLSPVVHGFFPRHSRPTGLHRHRKWGSVLFANTGDSENADYGKHEGGHDPNGFDWKLVRQPVTK